MSTSRTSSTPSTSLRPRAPRLISGLSDTDEDAAIQQTASASPPQSYTRSYPNSLHPSPERVRQSPRPRQPPRAGSGGSKSNAATFASLWGNSWNAIQGMANDFLGEQAPEQVNGTRVRRNSKGESGRLYVKPKTDSWGPKQSAPATPASYIATGSNTEREALVRAQKRKAMLSGAAATYPDASGKFKRRTSEDGGSASAPPGANEDRDALIYLHTVKPEDTLAGITIRYSCQANVLRKANRLWANDAVQIRKVLVLPVDACGVKGRPVSEHQADLLMDPERDESDLPTPRPNGTSHRRNESASSNISEHITSSSSHTSATDADPPWTHDSWVMFPNATKPTEIARLPRRALGYFPPARRKSISYSDLDTPSTSLDISRNTTYFDSTAPPSAGQSPLRSDPPQRPRRPRRTSNATNGYFPSYLAGPGGVGTMAKNVKTPGPAQDGLNRLFASKLPNVAPPPNQQNLYMPDVPIYQDEPSAPVTPRLSSGVGTPTGQGMGLENVGAAVEGWIRKMAVRAQKGLDGAETPHIRPGGSTGVGDLIEMADQWDLGSDEDRAARGRVLGEGSGVSYAAEGGARSRGKSRGKGAKGD